MRNACVYKSRTDRLSFEFMHQQHIQNYWVTVNLLLNKHFSSCRKINCEFGRLCVFVHLVYIMRVASHSHACTTSETTMGVSIRLFIFQLINFMKCAPWLRPMVDSTGWICYFLVSLFHTQHHPFGRVCVCVCVVTNALVFMCGDFLTRRSVVVVNAVALMYINRWKCVCITWNRMRTLCIGYGTVCV